MVEDVEEFGAEFDARGFRDSSIFFQREIGIHYARTMEEAPVRRTEASVSFSSKSVRKEVCIGTVRPRVVRVLSDNLSNQIGRIVRAVAS